MPSENPFDHLDDSTAPSDPFYKITDTENDESGSLQEGMEDQFTPSEKLGRSLPSARFSVIASLVCLGMVIGASVVMSRPESPIVRYAESREKAECIDYSSRLYPNNLTADDVISDLDAMYLNHLQPLVTGGQMSDWELFRELQDLFVDLSDAAVIASHINGAVPIAGQGEFRYIEEQVKDCAELFDIHTPLVFIKSDDAPNAYVTGLESPHILVVTSGFLETYSHRPDEMRFIIGHQIGHIACGHIRAHTLARFLISAIQGNGSSKLRSEIIAPALTLKLLEWSRASEMSADRAGLICVGRLGDNDSHARMVAEQALVRLLHGTKMDVDTDRYLEEIIQIQKDHRFVNLFTRLQRLNQAHPFIPDRCHAIRTWIGSEDYECLFHSGKSDYAGVIDVKSISLQNLPKTDYTPGIRECDVVVNVICDGQSRTVIGPKDVTSTLIHPFASDPWRFNLARNGKLILEVLDEDLSGTERIGCVVIHPQRQESGTQAKLIMEPDYVWSDTAIEVCFSLNRQ